MQWLVQVQEDPDSGQLKTGLASLDKVLRIQPGDYVLLAGRPSMGKSALGDQLGMGIARSTGGHVLNANFEMKLKEQINLRRLCREARLSSEVFLSGQAGEIEMAKLINGGSRLQDVLGRVWDVGVEARTIGSLRACARRLAEEHDLVCIVVDYLQLMEGPAGSHSREAAVSAISRGLRMLALDLNVAVIALSQLNREVEKRKDKRPQMSDLRESGSLEQDASSLAFVYRDEYYHPPGSEEHDPELAGIAEVIVAKQRNGQRNLTAHLGFDGPSTRFFDQDAYGAGGW